MSIELKNIDLSNVTITEQVEKLKEEINELVESEKTYLFINDEESRKHFIEEWWDMIQAHIGLLQKTYGITAEELMDHYNKYHLEKIKNRPR